MDHSAFAAAVFLPFVAPVCFYVAWKDLSEMRIPNPTVLLTFAIFVLLGPWVMPVQDYMWQLVYAFCVLAAMFVVSSAGLMGGGDAKFIAAATPFFALGDLRLVMFLFAATLIAAVCAHRFARAVPALRNLAPGWVSWEAGKAFPMGLALAGTLGLYLALAAAYGS